MNSTFKVIVVEDEKLIRNCIIESISLCDQSFEICASASNGKDALELLGIYNPDVLFTDIRMPIIDGLELAQKAKQFNPDIQIVIISGYAEFEYAQHALRLGVEDYLLKPIKQEYLKNILLKIKTVLSKNMHAQTKEMLKKIINTESPEKIPTILSNNNNIMLIVNLGNLCNNTPSTLVRSYYTELWNSVDLSFFQDDKCEIFIFDELSPNTKLLLLSIEKQVDYNNILYSLYIYLTQEFKHIDVQIYYSQYIDCESLSTQAENLRLVLRRQLVMDQSVLAKADFSDYTLPTSVLGCDVRTRLTTLINIEQTELLGIEITNQINSIIQNKMPQIWIEEYVHQLLKLFQQNTTCLSEAELYHIEYTVFDKMALPLSTSNLAANIWNSLPVFSNVPAIENQNLILEIKKYVTENYKNNITLNDIATKFNFTPTHIIKVFKRSTGETPIKYAINLRISIAKQLMYDYPAMEVKIISENVGYFDQHYFSRIFKSIVGVSPSEYRQSILDH